MSKFVVAVSDCRHSSYKIEEEILSQVGAELKYCNCATVEEMIKECKDVDAVLLDMAPFTAEVAKALPNCKVVSRYGVGFDNVDVAACTENGIRVTNVPDYCMHDVSEHAVALMLTCLRHVASRDKKIRGGQWNIQTKNTYRLAGSTMGVLGGGRIARMLIQKVSGFGFEKVLVYDPYLTAEQIASFGAVKAEMEEVLKESDFISLHMPVTEETRGMINAKTLAMMKPRAILINTARGPLVNSADLLDALKNNKIAAAGLDTHECEPLPKDSRQFEQLTCTVDQLTGGNIGGAANFGAFHVFPLRLYQKQFRGAAGQMPG